MIGRNVSHEARWIRRGVRDGFRWAGTLVVGRQVWSVSDYELGRVKHCPYCYDEVLKHVSNTHCPHCFGTGFEGGYQQPFTTWCSIMENQPQNERRTNNGVRPEGNTTIRLPVDRYYHDGDIFAEILSREDGEPLLLGRIYRLEGPVQQMTVQGWTSTNRYDDDRDTPLAEMLVEQRGTLKQLLPTDPIYKKAPEFFSVDAYPYPWNNGVPVEDLNIPTPIASDDA